MVGRRGEYDLDNKHDGADPKESERLRLELQQLLSEKKRTLAEIDTLRIEIAQEQENRQADADQLEQEKEVSRLLKQMVELEATQQKQHANQIAALNADIAGLHKAIADRGQSGAPVGPDVDSNAVQDQIRELGSAYQDLKREQELQKQMQIKEQKKLLDTVENLSRALEKSRGEGEQLREKLERERRDREAVDQAAATDRARFERERSERAIQRSQSEKLDRDRLEKERLDLERQKLQSERDRIEAERQRLEAEKAQKVSRERESADKIGYDRETLKRERERFSQTNPNPEPISNFNFSDDSGLDDESEDDDPSGLVVPKGPGINPDDIDRPSFKTISHADKGVFEQWKARDAYAAETKAQQKRKGARQLARRQARHIARREAKAAARAAAGSP